MYYTQNPIQIHLPTQSGGGSGQPFCLGIQSRARGCPRSRFTGRYVSCRFFFIAKEYNNMFQLRLGITTGRASLAETLVCPIRRFRTGPPGNMATFLSRPSASASSNSDKSARLFCTRKILFNTRRWQRLPPAPQMLPLQCLQCPVNERFPVGHESCNGYRFGAGHSVVQ